MTLTLTRRHAVAAAVLALLVVVLLLVRSLTGGGLSSADKRFIDRHEAALEQCYADDLDMTEKAMGCMQAAKIREQFPLRGLCRDLADETSGYYGVFRCDTGASRLELRS